MRQIGKLLPLVLFCTFLFFSTEARADGILFSNGPLVGTFSSTSNATSQGLTFTPSIGTGDAGVGVGYPAQLNFGYFVLSNTAATYNDTFNLRFSILNPQGTTPLVANFVANVTGQVSNNLGNVTIDFLNNTQMFNFNGAHGSGVFSLTLPDRIITSFNTENFFSITINLTSFTPAPIPEPTTIFLLGTGLVGLIGKSRRRKNAKVK